MVDDYMRLRKAELEKKIEEHKMILAKSPKGSLIISKNRGKNRYYHQKKKKDGTFERYYIGRKDIELARGLAQKTYFKALLKDEVNEYKCLKQYLDKRRSIDHRAIIDKNSPLGILLAANRWDMEDYDKNPSFPENLIVKAPKGEFVRSKSEALIANALFDNGIQYRYECGFEIGGHIIYPDFLVKKDNAEELIIWEHFGMIDEPEYFDNMMRKLSLYIRNGYLPGENLLMTFESKTNPLTIDKVLKVIANHLM